MTAKRILAMVMCIVMLVSIVPVLGAAAQGSKTVTI